MLWEDDFGSGGFYSQSCPYSVLGAEKEADQIPGSESPNRPSKMLS